MLSFEVRATTVSCPGRRVFVLYLIAVTGESARWFITTRFSQIRKLVRRVQCNIQLPRIPPKDRFGVRTDPESIERRSDFTKLWLEAVWEESLLNDDIFVQIADFLQLKNLNLFASFGDLALIRLAVDRLACPIEVDRAGSSPLHYAVSFGHFDACCDYLTERQESLWDLKDKFGLSPRMLKALKNAEEKEKDVFVPLQYKKKVQDRRLFIVFNPVGGVRTSADMVHNALVPLLRMMKIQYEIHATERAGHATEIAQKLDVTKWDIVVSVGGDGTLSELVNGIAFRSDISDIQKRVTISVVPGGTGNGLALSLGVSDVWDAVENVVLGTPIPMDLVKCWQPATGIVVYSFVLFAWGAVSDIDFDSEVYRWMGDLRFTVCALGKIIKGFGYNVKLSYPTHDEDEKTGVLPPFVDGKFSIPDDWSVFEGKTQVFMACNVAQVAKDMKPAPSATVDDGYIHLLMAHNLSRFDLLSFLISLESGSHVNDPRLLIHRTKKFVIEPLDENSTMDVDGERYGKASMACSIQPGLANIMAPQLHRHEDQL